MSNEGLNLAGRVAVVGLVAAGIAWWVSRGLPFPS